MNWTRVPPQRWASSRREVASSWCEDFCCRLGLSFKRDTIFSILIRRLTDTKTSSVKILMNVKIIVWISVVRYRQMYSERPGSCCDLVRYVVVECSEDGKR